MTCRIWLALLVVLCQTFDQVVGQSPIIYVDSNASGGEGCGSIAQPCSSVYEADARASEIYSLTSVLSVVKLNPGTHVIPHDFPIQNCVAVDFEDGGQNDCLDLGECGNTTTSQVFFNVQLQPNVSDVTVTSIAVQLASISGSVSGQVWTITSGGNYQTALDANSFPTGWTLLTTFNVSDEDSDTEFVIPGVDTMIEYRGFTVVIPTGEEIFFVQDGSLGCGSLDPCPETLTELDDDSYEKIQLSVAENTTNRFLGSVCFDSINTPPQANRRTDYLPNDGGYFKLEGDPLNPELVIIQVNVSTLDFYNQRYRWEEPGAYFIDGITFQGVRSFRFDEVNISISNCIFQGYTEDVSGREEVFEVKDAAEFTAQNLKFSQLAKVSAIAVDEVANVVLTNIEISDSTTCEYSLIYIKESGNVELTDVSVEHTTITGKHCVADVRLNGGAIYVTEVESLTMTNTYVGNVEGIIGTALSLVDTTSATVENFTAEHCASYDEGVIYLRNSLDETMLVNMRNTTIAHNTAVNAGSGLLFDGAVSTSSFFGDALLITNNSVTDHTMGTGGAVVVRGEYWSINFAAGSIDNNYAEFGGAVFTAVDVEASTSVSFQGTRFEHNSAADAGGCAFIGGSGNVSFTSLVISDSNTARAGGALYMPQTFSGYVTLDDVKIVNSETIETGGAVCADGGHTVLKGTAISYAKAGNGGGIYLGADGQIEATDSFVEHCVAEGEGPCVGTFGYGGGVFIADVRGRDINAEEFECAADRIDFTNFRFINNTARVSGGAYFLSQDAMISSPDEWERCSDEATWCSSCVMEANSAAFGDKQGAPFAYFTAPSDDSTLVTLGEEFQLDAVPHDGFGVHMDGDHAIIEAILIDPTAENPEIFLCGSLSATALSGSVSFSQLHVFLTEREGTQGSAASAANRGHPQRFIVKVEGTRAESNQNTLPLNIAGCSRHLELDHVPEEDLPSSCFVNEDGSQRTVPDLYACYEKVHLTEAGRQTVLSLMGVIYAFGFIPIAIAALLRNNRVVWSSSVKMLTTSAVGFFALMTSAFLRAIPPLSTAYCMSEVWLFEVGRDLLVGAVLAKNWRVWKIFSLKSLQVLKISDSKLLLGVVLASLPSSITLVVQTAFDPLTIDGTRVNSSCTSATELSFRYAHGVWTLMWIFGGLCIAYLVRNVPAKFNEWKTVVALTATMAVVDIIVLAVAPQFDAQTETIIAVITSCIGFTLSMFLILTPKLYLIYKRRDGTLLSNTFNSKSNVTAMTFDGDTHGGKASSVVPLPEGAEETPVFLFKERYRRLRAELQRTQKLYERSYENTQELQDRYRMVESDLVALQYEREYRAHVAHEDVSNISSEQSESQKKSQMRSRKRSDTRNANAEGRTGKANSKDHVANAGASTELKVGEGKMMDV